MAYCPFVLGDQPLFRRFRILIAALFVVLGSVWGARKEYGVEDSAQMEQAIAALREAYSAFNRGDIDAVTIAAIHPDIFKAYKAYEASFRSASQVNAALKELALLKVAVIIGCPA